MQRGGSRYNNGGYSSGGGNYQRSSNYGQPQQSAQSSWQPDAYRSDDQLNELNMKLEMVKRKRQMLQEERQLLEEQEQLDRMQSQRNPNPWEVQPNRQFNSQPQQSYNQYSNYQNRYDRANSGDQRGMKRPANQSPWQEQSYPKRFASAPAPRAFAPSSRAPIAVVRPPKPQHPSASQLDREIGPVATPPFVYRGDESLSSNARKKIHSGVSSIVREMKELYFCPPHNIVMENFQFQIMKTKITERMKKLLMNKPIPPAFVMHEMYRKTYIRKGDMRFIQIILSCISNKASVSAKPVQAANQNVVAKKTVAKSTVAKETIAKETKANITDKPKVTADAHLKENDTRALDAKLTEIFEKVQKIYADQAAEKISAKGAADVDMADETEAKKADDPDNKVEADEPESKVESESSPTAEDVTKTVSAPETEIEAKTSAKGDSKTESIVVSSGVEKKELSKQELVAFEALVDLMLRRKLPQVLPLYKNFILSIIARDPAFAKFDLKPEVKPVQLECLKFVKIFGRPTLPPRATMQQFLQQFEPASVKKHKKFFNLLFVGVPGHKFQSLLEHSGQIVGNKHLDILPAPQDRNDKREEMKSNDQKKASNGAAQTGYSESKDITIGEDAKAAVKPANEPVVISLNDDSQAKNETLNDAMKNLDDEIDELLTSIKQSDDADNVNATAENIKVTGDDVEDTGDNTDEAGDSGENAEGNDLEAAENVEKTSKSVEKAGDSVEKTGDSVEKTETQVKEKSENSEGKDGNAEEVKAPGTPVGTIKTRRSSRLPQKN